MAKKTQRGTKGHQMVQFRGPWKGGLSARATSRPIVVQLWEGTGSTKVPKILQKGGLMQCDRLERAKAWMNQGSWRPVNPSLPLQKPFKSAKAAGRACSYLYLPGYDRSLKIERTLTNTAYVSTGNAELSHGRGHSCLKPLLHLRWSESRTNISIQCT